MQNEFMTDEEYNQCFETFWGIRSKIAHALTAYGLIPGVCVLDVPAGHGFFSYEVARILHKGEIHAVGLLNDHEAFETFSHSVKNQDCLKLITYHIMDATQLAFHSELFDFVINFLGLEDINMTRGVEGVRKSLSEFVRVLKPGGVMQITLCLEGDEKDERLSREIMRYIGFNALFYPKDFYLREFEKLGVRLLNEQWFYTCRKMTAVQAKEELQFACDETPKLFQSYGVCTTPFEKVWEKFGEKIEEHGMAYYSDLCVLIGEKRGV